MGGGLCPEPAFSSSVRGSSAPPARSQIQNNRKKGDSGRWRPEEGGNSRRGGGEGGLRGGEREGVGKAGWGIGQTPRHFLASWLARDGPAPPSRGPGTQQPGSRLLLSFPLWRAPSLTRREIGMREQGDDRSRTRGSLPGQTLGHPHPRSLSALSERHLSPRGAQAPRGGALQPPPRLPGSVTLLPFP